MFGRQQGMGMNCRQGQGMQNGFGCGNRRGINGKPGLGRGFGTGRGMGKGYGMMAQVLETPEQEIEVLERISNCLKQDMEQVNSRIEALKSQPQ